MESSVFIVCKREIKLKLQSKIVAFSFLFLVAITTAAPWISHFSSGNQITKVNLGVVQLSKGDKKILENYLGPKGSPVNPNLKFIDFPTIEVARKLYDKDKLSAIISESSQSFSIAMKNPVNRELENVLYAALQQFQQLRFNAIYNVDISKYNDFTKSHKTTISNFSGSDNSNELIALSAVLLLYSLISLSSGLLALTVVEEKSSKVMEVLLSSIQARTLLVGKILGGLIFSSIEFMIVLACGLASSSLAGLHLFHNVRILEIVSIFIWFVPAITSFSFLYGGLGAMISRSEDAGAVQGPLGIVLLSGLYLGTFASVYPSNNVVRFMSFVPPFSFFTEPARLITKSSSVSEVLGTYSICWIFTLFIIKICTALFENNVLKRDSFKSLLKYRRSLSDLFSRSLLRKKQSFQKER